MTAAVLEITAPCVVPDMAEDVYHRDPVPAGSLSSGGARLLLEPGGPAKFAWKRDQPATTTATFDLGKAAHTVALGAGAGVVEVHADSWRTNAAKAARDEAHQAGLTPLLTADYQRVRTMVDAILAHPIAGALLTGGGEAEQSLFWIDQETGVWCRARHDLATRDRAGRLNIVDLKTCQSADLDAVEKSVARYGYHQQASHYIDAAVALDLDDDPGFLFVFVEKEPPHLVQIAQLDQEAITLGRGRNRRARELYARCTETGTWPGYPVDIPIISLPTWAREDMW